MGDGGYLILSGTYAANKTDNIPVTYRVPFKPAGNETGNYIEVAHNHRYMVKITDADEYHLDFTLNVADWADEGTVDNYKPDNDFSKDALALADALESLDVPVRVQTAITMEQFAEPYIRNRAVRHMEKDRVVIFGCGTGNPFFSTDTAAALRAAEIDADAILKATMVDGVYDKDPKKYPDAKRYSTVSFSQVLAQNLNVMDMTAASLCRESKIPIVVFDLSDPENICRALCGYDIGTIVKEA